MSDTPAAVPSVETTTPEKKSSPCCACPETKKARDAW